MEPEKPAMEAQIKPDSLRTFALNCDDEACVGRVVMALCGKEKKLNAMEQSIFKIIEHEMNVLTDFFNKKREAENERKRKYRERMQAERDGCPRDRTDVPPKPNQTEQNQIELGANQVRFKSSKESNLIKSSQVGSISACVKDNNSTLNAREENGSNEGENSHHPPSREQVMMVASSNHIDKKFAEDFFDDMECDGWQYINNAGATVNVTAKNVGIVIRGRWQNLQKRKERSKKTTQPKGVIYQEADYDFSKFEGERP